MLSTEAKQALLLLSTIVGSSTNINEHDRLRRVLLLRAVLKKCIASRTKFWLNLIFGLSRFLHLVCEKVPKPQQDRKGPLTRHTQPHWRKIQPQTTSKIILAHIITSSCNLEYIID